MPAAQSAAFQHDQPQVSNDLYSRKPFAEQLASLLVLPPKSPGVVIGIEGPWGSGKTTVVRYIVESLKTAADGAPIVVEFNPWMLAGADALVEALLTELASGIGMDAGKKRAKKSLEAAGKILGYAGLLRHLKYLKYVPGVSLVGVAADTVGNALHDASKLATKAGEGVDNAKKVVEEAEKLVSIKAGLSERKREVIKALAKLDRSIVVIVDDLDRLTPDEIKAVFRTIKAVADFPRVAYLLAYDRNVVSESLGGGPVAGGNAYIEKIVQVAYPISPAFPWQLQSHISGELASLRIRAAGAGHHADVQPLSVSAGYREAHESPHA
jgi:predicted KAP-like P-loop ATPase